MKKITLSVFMLLFSLAMFSQTVFDFNSGITLTDGAAFEDDDIISQTVDGVTLDAAGQNLRADGDANSVFGFPFPIPIPINPGSGDGFPLYTGNSEDTFTFTFSEVVDVNSIIAYNMYFDSTNPASIEYTFVPTGGSNTNVIATTVDGIIDVDLNWTGVTSFQVLTVYNSGGGSGAAVAGFDNLSVTIPPTTFEFTTAVIAIESGFAASNETIDGLEAKVTLDTGNANISDNSNGTPSEDFGAMGNFFNANDFVGTTTITFPNATSVDVGSILVVDLFANFVASSTITFTPTGGTGNSVVTATIDHASDGGFSVNPTLNWTGITSFTVTTSAGTGMFAAFDNLVINDFELVSLSTSNDVFENISVYPNPVVNELNIRNLQNIEEVTVYNSLGKMVKKIANTSTIDFTDLSTGLYFVQIKADNKVVTKKVLKN